MVEVYEHLVEPALLSPGGWILDVGSGYGEFAQHFAAYGFKVLAVDPHPSISAAGQNIFLERVALVPAHFTGPAEYAICNSGYLYNHVKGLGYDYNVVPFLVEQGITYVTVPFTTVNALMVKYTIGQFELAKFDCEGCECLLLEQQTAFAKQLSVEFHTHLGQGEETVQAIRDHLLGLGYRIEGRNERDTLFVIENHN